MTDEMKAADATRYMVVQIDAKDATNIGEAGMFSSEGDARKHAEGLARENEGQIVAVYQKVGSATLTRQVEWKGAR